MVRCLFQAEPFCILGINPQLFVCEAHEVHELKNAGHDE